MINVTFKSTIDGTFCSYRCLRARPAPISPVWCISDDKGPVQYVEKGKWELYSILEDNDEDGQHI